MRRYISELIIIICLLMNQLWGCRYELVHIKASEEVEIKEYQDLPDKLDKVIILESS